MRNAMWVGGGITGMGEIPMLGVKEKGIAKVIRDIFRNGEKGFFYDPSDLSTMFQDAAGTFPVTAVGQPVGLMLDKSKGRALKDNIATIDSVTGTGIGGSQWKTTLVVPASNINLNAWYEFSCKVVNYTGTGDAGFATLSLANVPLSSKAKSANGEIRFIAQATGSISLYTRDSNNADFTDIRVREVLGNHAYQTTSASRPILRKNAVTGANYLEFDGVDDYLEIGFMAAPKPFSTMHGVNITKLVSGAQAILSGAANGYLYAARRSEQPELVVASQQLTSNPQIQIERGDSDVFFMRSDARGLNIKTNKDSVTRLDIVATDPYGANSRKFIGTYSVSLAAYVGMHYYGGVLIAKSLTDGEESELRAHFNKRIGI